MIKLHGWIMVGPSNSGKDLPPEMYVGHFAGAPPEAANFQVGQWLIWQYGSYMHAQMTLICVEVSIFPPSE